MFNRLDRSCQKQGFELTGVYYAGNSKRPRTICFTAEKDGMHYLFKGTPSNKKLIYQHEVDFIVEWRAKELAEEIRKNL